MLTVWRGPLSKKAFDKIAAGLTEAIAIARGEAKPARLYVPSEIDVRSLRKTLGFSQDDFAAHFGFTLNQIRNWEQERSRPIGGERAYLMMIESNPSGVLNMLAVVNRREHEAA